MAHTDDLYLGKKEYQVLGRRPVRHDGADKVTGKAVYTSDVQLPNMAHGKIVRSPHAHARIKSIDASEALTMPGVFAVVTADDFPNLDDKIAIMGEAGQVNLAHLAANCLAKGKVLYKGHAVAAVAAANVHLAEEAAAKIKVEYEVLPSVTWVLDAMKDGAPLLHDDLRTDSMGKKGDKPTNVAAHLQFEKGNVAEGFKQADVVVEREFRTASVHQGYIEPHVAVAMWNEDGRLKIWTATQGAFNCRQQVAELLQIPVSQVRRRALRDRRRLRRQDRRLPGAGRGAPEPQVRPAGEDGDAAERGLRGDRPDARLVHAGQAGGEEGRHARGRRGLAGLRLRRVSRRRDRPGLHVRLQLLRAAPRQGRRLRRLRQQAQDAGLPRPRRDAGRVRLRAGHRRAGREARHRPDRVPPEERRQGGDAPGRRAGLSARRLHRDACRPRKNSDHWKSPLEGKNRGRGIAGGFWFNIGGASSCSASVNDDGIGDPGRRLDRHRRHAHQHRHATGRDPGHRGRGRPAAGRRHRLRRLHVPHRRQPRDVRHRAGRLQAGARHPASR